MPARRDWHLLPARHRRFRAFRAVSPYAQRMSGEPPDAGQETSSQGSREPEEDRAQAAFGEALCDLRCLRGVPASDAEDTVRGISNMLAPEQVQRRRLRIELRMARLDARQTQGDVAEAMDWSLSKVIRIETGAVGTSTNDLKALLRFYKVRDPNVGVASV